MLVRDHASASRLQRFVGSLGTNSQDRPGHTNRERLIERRARDLGIGLSGEDWLRVMATQPERRPEIGKAFFQASGDVLPVARGLGMGVAGLRIPGDARGERLADAVAAAGLEISGGGRRRAVLLVVDPRTPDVSSLTPHQAGRYLTAMRVPLEVWTAGDVEAVRRVWGAARDAPDRKLSRLRRLGPTLRRVGAALRNVLRLRSQRSHPGSKR